MTHVLLNRLGINIIHEHSRPTLTKQRTKVLVLLGPSGCGKTTTLQVVCRDLGCSLIEWINPVSQELVEFEDHFRWESQRTQFQEFLLRSRKYRSLDFGKESSVSRKHVILVEDLPNYLNMPNAVNGFHDMLRSYNASAYAPLVFIITEEHLGSRCCCHETELEQPPVDSSRPPSKSKDFSKSSGNPVVATKILDSFSTVFRSQAFIVAVFQVSTEAIKCIAANSNGDIRIACNTLQLNYRPSQGAFLQRPYISSRKFSKRCAVSTKPSSQLLLHQSRDYSMKLFHAIGRILRAKRKPSTGCQDAESTLPSMKYVKFMVDVGKIDRRSNIEATTGTNFNNLGSFCRTPLVAQSKPEETLQQTGMSTERFCYFLHQNFIEHFTDFDDLVSAADVFSQSDILSEENWKKMDEYSGMIVTRGLVFYNTAPLQSGWRPLQKPLLLTTTARLSELTQMLRSPAYAMVNHSAARCSLRDLVINIVPYLHYSKVQEQLLTEQQEIITLQNRLCLTRRPKSFTANDHDVDSDDDETNATTVLGEYGTASSYPIESKSKNFNNNNRLTTSSLASRRSSNKSMNDQLSQDDTTFVRPDAAYLEDISDLTSESDV
eukprot:gene9565-1792_t